jgi:hypothetical protein
MDNFLRACGLEPINFGELRAEMGGTPTIADIVERGMSTAQGVIALFTPDEHGVLRGDLKSHPEEAGESAERWQARPK